MTIATTSDTTVPTIGTNTIYGRYPYICGTNTGYHCEYVTRFSCKDILLRQSLSVSYKTFLLAAYIDMSCTCTDEATLSFILGSTTTNNWKIKVFGDGNPSKPCHLVTGRECKTLYTCRSHSSGAASPRWGASRAASSTTPGSPAPSRSVGAG